VLDRTSNLLNFLDNMLSTGGIRNSGIASDLVDMSRREVNEIVALVESAVPKLAEIAPSASANTGSPKLPSAEDVWNHVRENSPALVTFARIAADRRVAELVYNYIARQLRAGA